MNLRTSEINRASVSNSGRLYTVVTRPYTKGVLVSTIIINPHLTDHHVIFQQIVTNGEVSEEIKNQLRMMDKCGWGGDMASSSRHRQKDKT